MTFVKVAAVAAIVAASVSLGAQAGPRIDGNWEMTIQMEMPGMPAGMAMPPMKSMQCITKEQAKDPKYAMPQNPQQRGECTTSDYKATGNKITFAFKCTGQMATSGTGEVVYTADTSNGTLVMNMERGGTPMKMTMKSTGKRLGDCEK